MTDKSPFSVKQPRKTKGRDRLMLKKTREGKKEVKKEEAEKLAEKLTSLGAECRLA